MKTAKMIIVEMLQEETPEWNKHIQEAMKSGDPEKLKEVMETINKFVNEVLS